MTRIDIKQCFIKIGALFSFVLMNCNSSNTHLPNSKEIINDTAYYYDTNGELKSKAPLDSLQRFHGMATVYWSSEKIKQTIEYNHGVLEGETNDYYESGELYCSTSILNGNKEGQAVCYYKNGTKSSDAFFHQDKIEGFNSYYYENGALRSINYYKNGHRDMFAEYDSLGQLTRRSLLLKAKEDVVYNPVSNKLIIKSVISWRHPNADSMKVYFQFKERSLLKTDSIFLNSDSLIYTYTRQNKTSDTIWCEICAKEWINPANDVIFKSCDTLNFPH